MLLKGRLELSVVLVLGVLFFVFSPTLHVYEGGGAVRHHMPDVECLVSLQNQGILNKEELKAYGALLCSPSGSILKNLIVKDRERLRRYERKEYLKSLRSYRLSGLICNDHLEKSIPPVADEAAFKCLPGDYRRKACMDGLVSMPEACSSFRQREANATEKLRIHGNDYYKSLLKDEVTDCDAPNTKCDSYFMGIKGSPITPGQLPSGMGDARVISQRSDGKPIWTNETLNYLLDMIQKDLDIEPVDYPGAHSALKRAFQEAGIRDKRVLVMGSITPWVEALSISMGAATPTTTVDYNQPHSEDPRLQTMHMNTLLEDLSTWPVVVSYSSLEHDGQGRYGDPLDPDGDLAAMKEVYLNTEPGGILVLEVPLSYDDSFYWYSQRMYGPARLPLLTRGWQYKGLATSDRFFATNESFTLADIHDKSPVILLRKPDKTFQGSSKKDGESPAWLDTLDTRFVSGGLECDYRGICGPSRKVKF